MRNVAFLSNSVCGYFLNHDCAVCFFQCQHFKLAISAIDFSSLAKNCG